MQSPSEEDDDSLFYSKHRGGSGNVWVVLALNDAGQERTAVFGSIDTAKLWIDQMSDEWTTVSVPYVVDEPEYGSIPKRAQQ